MTPLQMAATVSSLVNGGKRITPHFGVKVADRQGENIRMLSYEEGRQIVSEETSATMRMILEQVVESSSGKNSYVETRVGGKTATRSDLQEEPGILPPLSDSPRQTILRCLRLRLSIIHRVYIMAVRWLLLSCVSFSKMFFLSGQNGL